MDRGRRAAQAAGAAMLQPAVRRFGGCCGSGARGRPQLATHHVMEPLAVSRGCGSTAVAPQVSGRRGFATAAFTVRASGPSTREQTIFVVGLNNGKFFGQDGAEEGLKLLERITEQKQEYQLLLGLNEKDLGWLEDEYKVDKGRLTPSRELALVKHGEMVPLMQASVVDKRPRFALGRPLKTTQGHVAWRLWKNPREVLRLLRVFRKRKAHKDAARAKFWSEHLPKASHVYFGESAELIVIRTLENLIAERQKGQGGSTVLAVSNEIFASVVDRLRHYVTEDVADNFADPAYSDELKKNAAALCQDVPDMTPLLILIYLGFPLAALHQVMLFCEYLYIVGVDRYQSGQEFDLVTGSRE